MSYTILKHNCTELEVAVKVCVKNISKLLYCKVLYIYDAGIEALACTRLLRLRLRLHDLVLTMDTTSSDSPVTVETDA